MASKITLMPLQFVCLIIVVVMMHGSEAQQQPLVKGLSWKYYESSCPKLESVVRKQLEKGCDGSVLLDGSASGPVDSEKTAPPNLSLRGFDIIEDLRRRVHKQCGAGSVSCSDITAIAARDAIVLTGGPEYSVPLGRRDGVSFATRDATLANLPSPFVPTETLLTTLAPRNFDATDAVALSGAHTIGVAHCPSFTRRLYPTQDATMDQTFAGNLKGVCPDANTNATTFMDIRSPNVFDNKYYVDLMNKQGLLTSDQDLYTDTRTRAIVTSFAVNQTLFFEKFVNVMVKMGQMEVLTGAQGEIRNNCSVRNSNDVLISSVVEGDNIESF
ncbi:heme peroxidase [Cynara cardunculus var. scolymus]|uniref:Peroxidase n=1 Tax=Cynara cardunculus var. scolymus TaxID=59895 RepID=A0A103XZ47_CYNCS|nr:heme peroxidase [Cynara cardunculus var. scolymus]